MKWTMPSRREIRHANIGIVVAAMVLLAGVLVFKDAGEGALEVVCLVGFASGLVVSHALESLASRRERHEGREPQ
jgi:hypothetical protein